MLWGFSDQARAALTQAHEEATSRGADELSAAHVLVGLAQTDGAGKETLEALGVDLIEVVAICRGKVPVAGEPTNGPLSFDASARAMLDRAIESMRETEHRTVFSAHVLLALFRAGGTGREVLELVGVDESTLRQAVNDALALSTEISGA